MARIPGAGWVSGVLLALAVQQAPAAPAAWVVVPEGSSIAFDYSRAGQVAVGKFTEFTGTGQLDPGDPVGATLEIRIDSKSIDLGDSMASGFATSAEWFDSRNTREVVYRLRKLTPTGGDSYSAEGDLTIRGQTKAIVTPVTLSIGADKAHATGSLAVVRADYGLGVGPSAAFVEIGPDVAVRFDLIAKPAP